MKVIIAIIFAVIGYWLFFAPTFLISYDKAVEDHKNNDMRYVKSGSGRTHAFDVLRKYEDNAVAADNYFSSSPVQIYGQICSIEKDFQDKPVILFKTENDFKWVKTIMADTEITQVAKLKKEDVVMTRCEFIRQQTTSPTAENCVLIDNDGNPLSK